MVKRLSYRSLSSFAQGKPVAANAVSGQAPSSVDLQEALEMADMKEQHDKLMRIAEDGVVDWGRFDIIEFASLMPSIAILDRVETAQGEPDFQYGYVGESINEIAQKPLKGLTLGEVLVGEAKDTIIAEYQAALGSAGPRASVGRVVISDLDWVHYMRFLYPVRRNGEVDRILLIMLYAL